MNSISHVALLFMSTGRRRCLGEALARSCLFIFFAGVLQNFEILPVPGKELPGEAPVPGLTLSPQPYSVMLKPRLGHDVTWRSVLKSRHTSAANVLQDQ
jgi:cytochrome P450